MNTIFFTPSNEQLVKIANETPELYEELKSSMREELKRNALKFVTKNLQNKAHHIYEGLYSEVEKTFFKKSSTWGSMTSFSPQTEKTISKALEEAINSQIQKEIEDYIHSSSFQSILKSKMRERLLSIVLKSLDEEINEEANKLIKG